MAAYVGRRCQEARGEGTQSFLLRGICWIFAAAVAPIMLLWLLLLLLLLLWPLTVRLLLLLL